MAAWCAGSQVKVSMAEQSTGSRVSNKTGKDEG